MPGQEGDRHWSEDATEENKYIFCRKRGGTDRYNLAGPSVLTISVNIALMLGWTEEEEEDSWRRVLSRSSG